MSNNIRDGMIHQAQQERMVRDTKIMQKVNSLHREAFKERFPGQCEHILRLIAERLQGLLVVKPADLGNPETWTTTAADIASLSEALYNMYMIHKEVNNAIQRLSTQEK